MPVVLGASNPLSGSGTWTYPDPSLIIGLKLDLTTPPSGSRASVIGTSVRFWRSVGRYALVDEAGTLAARNLSNDQVVDYELSRAPVGVNFEWAAGAVVTATEILSASPSGGGGTGGVTTVVIYDVSTPTNVPVATLTKLVPDTLDAHTDDTVITPDGAGGVTLVPAGIYTITWNCTIPEPTAVNNAEIQIYVNGSSFWTAAGGYLVSSGTYSLSGSYQWLATAGTTVAVWCYQDGPNPENVYPYWSIQGPWPT